MKKPLHNWLTECFPVDYIVIEETKGYRINPKSSDKKKSPSLDIIHALAWNGAIIYGFMVAMFYASRPEPEFIFVKPRVWKNDIGLSRHGARLTPTERKHISLDCARNMAGWNSFSKECLTRVKDHNIAEAALIGWWGYRQAIYRQRNR